MMRIGRRMMQAAGDRGVVHGRIRRRRRQAVRCRMVCHRQLGTGQLMTLSGRQEHTIAGRMHARMSVWTGERGAVHQRYHRKGERMLGDQRTRVGWRRQSAGGRVRR